nr:MAG TPA: hypothetical protein [Caudoviricetes sp.]
MCRKSSWDRLVKRFLSNKTLAMKSQGSAA